MSSGSCIDRNDCWLTWEEDEGGEEIAILNFSDSFLETAGWIEGDEIEFTDLGNGSILIKKLEKDD